jgi:nitrous oxide reductase
MHNECEMCCVQLKVLDDGNVHDIDNDYRGDSDAADGTDSDNGSDRDDELNTGPCIGTVV